MKPKLLEGLLNNDPGTYALILKSKEYKEVEVGKLGKVCLHEGYYVYVDSAFGSDGIRSRVGHHMNTNDYVHGHVDYIKKETELVEVWYTYSTEIYEHLWSNTLLLCHGASVPYPSFGSSDCDCISHLVFFKIGPSFKEFIKKINESLQTEEALKINRIELQ